MALERELEIYEQRRANGSRLDKTDVGSLSTVPTFWVFSIAWTPRPRQHINTSVYRNCSWYDKLANRTRRSVFRGEPSMPMIDTKHFG